MQLHCSEGFAEPQRRKCSKLSSVSENFKEKKKRKKKKNLFKLWGICSISAVSSPTSDDVGVTVKTRHAVSRHRTCMKVHPHGEQRPCDGHERLAVVVGVESDAADSLVDRVHQEGVHTCTAMANRPLRLKQEKA